MDGDGENEIIVATDQKLMILDPNVANKNDDQFKRIGIKREVTFKTSTSSIVGRRPLKMESGYLEITQEGKTRKKVIVILTDGYVLLCFNHNLKLIWETTIDHLPPDVYFKEIAIAITPSKIRVNDKGLVVVGNTLVLKKLAEHFA